LEKLAIVRAGTCITPWQLGPSTLIPALAPMSRTVSWSARPSAPTSAKPDENTMAARAPVRAASTMTSGTRAAGVNTNTRSTGYPTSRSVGTHSTPSASVRFGFTPMTEPGYSNR
jgi:hypothetical protein